jgi:8-oxo-dGTP pyrophosphatase MutT (NUDIX family)
MKAWRRLSSKVLIRDQWLSLRADRCELPGGLIIEPYYVLEEAEWVHIFAQDADGRILVVRQYRYAADTICTELPGGAAEQGESTLAAAQRELREETGYVANEWTFVGKSFANPARQTNSIHLYVARGLDRQGEQNLDASEHISLLFASPGEVKAMIARDEFSQALHIASFYRGLEASSGAI